MTQQISEPKIGDNARRVNHRGAHGRVNDRAVDAEHHIGDHMADGTIYAGISPFTKKPMFTTPADAPLTSCTFIEAKNYAARLDAHGHHDWRVPTKAELNVLFNNRAAIGGVGPSISDPLACHWSSSTISEFFAPGQRFSDGLQADYSKYNFTHPRLRCVR